MSEKQVVSLPKTMLILKSQATGLGVVETFLRNRGWQLLATADLKDALLHIVSQKPSYVLISVDHPNKKVRGLPKLLSSAFPVVTFVFAEIQTSSSYKILNEALTEYRIYPPLTGPAIERCVNKYLKDQQIEMPDKSHGTLNSEKSPRAGNDSISIKGGSQGTALNSQNDSEFEGGDATRLLSQFLGEEAGLLTSFSTTKDGDSGVLVKSPKTDDQTSALQSKVSATGASLHSLTGTNRAGSTFVQKGSAGNIGTFIPPADPKGGSNQIQNSQAKDPNFSGHQEGTEDASSKKGLGSRERRRRQSAANWAPMEEADRLHHIRNRRKLSEANDTLIARGTKQSLEESVEIRDGAVKGKIEETTSAACIVVESSRFSGYLVAVMGKNCKIDKVFIESIRVKLLKFLEENGEKIIKGDSLDIKIRQVDFEPWALDYAEFLRKSVHQGNEVAMAFFPRRSIQAILEDSDHKDMAKIHFDELQGDRQVEFDLYVYLPNNHKYVLYTPKGGVFYNKQMDRLKNQGVTHMHVQKDAAEAITKYQAQNYLNDMIEEHEQKQEIITKSKRAS